MSQSRSHRVKSQVSLCSKDQAVASRPTLWCLLGPRPQSLAVCPSSRRENTPCMKKGKAKATQTMISGRVVHFISLSSCLLNRKSSGVTLGRQLTTGKGTCDIHKPTRLHSAPLLPIFLLHLKHLPGFPPTHLKTMGISMVGWGGAGWGGAGGGLGGGGSILAFLDIRNNVYPPWPQQPAFCAPSFLSISL